MHMRLDLAIARNVHLNWELKLESLEQSGQGDIALQTHENCELGLWLHNVGVEKYGSDDTIHELIRTHKRFHKSAESVIANLKSPHPGPKLAMAEVRNMSRDIILLLTRMELRALENNRSSEALPPPPPLRRLLSRLFDGPQFATPEDYKILEISHARLQHLRWTLAMPDAFRNWGHNAILEPAETCALGVWIHAVGMRRHQDVPAIATLDEMHKAFHDKATATILALRKHNGPMADQAYREMLELSRETIYLLAMLEFQLLDTDSIARTASILDDAKP
ncbi:MAG: CZB domain-containing protein [Magnetococcales bacterium]|nr:CZB domain-containing protein [Magnetococcales bacterium]MBF0322682.1 CZB domain-containing protein [Magnetococcales bacterium]